MENHAESVADQLPCLPDNGENSLEKISFALLWKAARTSLKGHWGSGVLACLVPIFIQMAANAIPLVCLISGILLFPLTVGVMLFFLRLVRQENPRVESVFEPFRQYGRMLWGYFRVLIFIFLHFLLLIIPGYVAMLRYGVTYYVMLDDPACSVKDAMIMSREIMYGHKWQLLGYMLLLLLIALPIGILTLGIAFFWIAPFVQAFCANFYERVRREYEFKQAQTLAE